MEVSTEQLISIAGQLALENRVKDLRLAELERANQELMTRIHELNQAVNDLREDVASAQGDRPPGDGAGRDDLARVG